MKFTGWEERSRYSRNLSSRESGQRHTRAKVHGTFSFFSMLLDFFCDGAKVKVIIVVFPFCFSESGACRFRYLSLVFQRVLQGIWFVPVKHDTGRKGKMPGFDCVVPITGSNVPVFPQPFLALAENLFFQWEPRESFLL